jgi:prefoldin subunit 5
MVKPARTVADLQAENDQLRAQIERLRAVAEAADQASLTIDEDIRTLEPQVNNMQEAAAALTVLVNLTGSVQRTLVAALTELQPGDRSEAKSESEPSSE